VPSRKLYYANVVEELDATTTHLPDASSAASGDARITGVLFSPSKTFADIAQRRLGPLFLCSLL
jgi:hypothetical protein